METITFSIDGMSCEGCAVGIDRVLKAQKGVISAQTFFADKCSEIRFNPQEINAEKLKTVIEDAGFDIL